MHPRPALYGLSLGRRGGFLYERIGAINSRMAGRCCTARVGSGELSVHADVQKPFLLRVPGAFQGLEEACEKSSPGEHEHQYDQTGHN